MSQQSTFIRRRPDIWGWPWHGRVEYDAAAAKLGKLFLPNGSTMEVEGTTGLDNDGRITPYAGTVEYGKLDGVVAVTRTAAELVDDQAAGRTWRNDVIGLRGGVTSIGHVVYGKWVQGSWVWRDSTGERWLCNMTVPSQGPNIGGTGGLVATLNVVRFGKFGAAAVQRVVSINLNSAQIGQAAPVLEAHAYRDLAVVYWDSTRNGDKALFAVVSRMWIVQATTAVAVQPMRPIGFIEVSLSGSPMDAAPSATWSVKASRAAALGNVSYANSGTINWGQTWATDSTQVDDTNPNDTLIYTVTYNGWKVQSGTGYYGTNGTQTVTASATDALVSMYYKADDTIETLSVDWTYSYTISATTSNSASGQYEQHAQDGNYWLTGSISAQITSGSTCNTTDTRVLKRGSTVIDTVTQTTTSTTTSTATIGLNPSLGPVETSKSTTVSISRTTHMGSGSVSNWTTGSFWPYNGAHAPEYDAYTSAHALYRYSTGPGMYALPPAGVLTVDTPTVWYSLLLWPYSTRSAGFVGYNATDVQYRPIGHPGGTEAQAQDTDQATPRLYGSDNPATGEYTVGRTWRAWM